MKIAIVTDTWFAINGVVTTLRATAKELENRGHEVLVVEPSQFKFLSFPKYPDIHLVINIYKLKTILDNFSPDAIHIATEGPLGLAARFYCKRHRDIPYTSSYHTKFPEYLYIYYKIPKKWTYAYLRWFHKISDRVLVTTQSMKVELQLLGFSRLTIWGRGVNTDIFYAKPRPLNSDPILLCVSRVSKEKNLEDFCNLKGRRILVGDGPYLNTLRNQFPDVEYVGYKTGSTLADYYRQADVFVFPSRSDTFGVVIIEALACGTPVAAYPVTGPKDIIVSGLTGYLSDSLAVSVEKCLSLNRKKVQAESQKYTWKAATDIFESSLVKIK